MKPFLTPPSRLPMVSGSVDKSGRLSVLNSSDWMNWFADLARRNQRVVQVYGYVKADLIAANRLAPADWASTTGTAIIYVTDAAGGASTAYSDGVSWISHKTGVAV